MDWNANINRMQTSMSQFKSDGCPRLVGPNYVKWLIICQCFDRLNNMQWYEW